MTIIPSIRKKIIFNKSFPESIKEEVCERFFEKIHELNITALYDITYNYSAEGGFEMPKTAEWIEHLEQQKLYIHRYQGSRQLRFIINNNNINEAYCKDGINIFTDYELDTILYIINDILSNLSVVDDIVSNLFMNKLTIMQ